jgi:hypothetical protein
MAPVPVWSLPGVDVITRAPQGALVFGLLPVVPMTIVSALLMFVVSRLTAAARPGADTLARYFAVPVLSAASGLASRTSLRVPSSE